MKINRPTSEIATQFRMMFIMWAFKFSAINAIFLEKPCMVFIPGNRPISWIGIDCSEKENIFPQGSLNVFLDFGNNPIA